MTPRHEHLNQVFRDFSFPKQFLQQFPSTATLIEKELSIIETIPAEDIGYAEDEMAVGSCTEDSFTKLLFEFHHPLLAV
jgi:hypothetical protein